MKLAIRLTLEWNDMLHEYFDRFDRAVVYQHNADEEVSRTHVHALVETDVTTDTMKNHLQKILGYRLPASDWSFVSKLKRLPVEDKFITYMSKGKLEPVYTKGFTAEEIERYKSDWIERTEPGPANTTDKDGLKQISSYQISKELAAWIDSKTSGTGWFYYQGRFTNGNTDNIEITEEEVIEKCIGLHNKYSKSYCDFSLVRVIQTSYGLSEKGHWKKKLVESVKQKLALRL